MDDDDTSDDLKCRQRGDWQRWIRTRLAKWSRKLVPEMRWCIAKWSMGDFKDETRRWWSIESIALLRHRHPVPCLPAPVRCGTLEMRKQG